MGAGGHHPDPAALAEREAVGVPRDGEAVLEGEWPARAMLAGDFEHVQPQVVGVGSRRQPRPEVGRLRSGRDPDLARLRRAEAAVGVGSHRRRAVRRRVPPEQAIHGIDAHLAAARAGEEAQRLAAEQRGEILTYVAHRDLERGVCERLEVDEVQELGPGLKASGWRRGTDGSAVDGGHGVIAESSGRPRSTAPRSPASKPRSGRFAERPRRRA